PRVQPLALRPTKQFKRDVERMKKRGKDIAKLQSIINSLVQRNPLGPQYRDHALTGELKGSRDCRGWGPRTFPRCQEVGGPFRSRTSARLKRPVGWFFRCWITSRRGQDRLGYEVLTETRPNPSRRIPFSGLLHSVVRGGARGSRRETRDDYRTQAASNARGGAARPGAHRGPGVDAAPEPGCRADDHRGDRRRAEAASAAVAGNPGGRAGRADLEAVQAGQPGVSSGRSGDRGQGSEDRR